MIRFVSAGIGGALGMRKRPDGVSRKDTAYLAFGKAMANWALLELFHWFQRVTFLKLPQARRVFYANKNFAARAEMLREVLPESGLEAPEVAVIEAVVKRAAGFCTFRNSLAHGEVTFEGIVDPRYEYEEALARGYAVADIETAANQFLALAEISRQAHAIATDDGAALILQDYLDGHRPSLETLLQRVLALPKNLP
ncbi:hypothetical protein OO17_24125 [Rhodopseudomonas palustris]|uniref:Uncharacterized protein n=2 Tax=Nitrobacteraceae TaxID=41294 RepID=A0A0D7E907_RHOPL|nr:hypothetical protein OO17_24125 [Rhodopseudomonas palustris]